MQKLGDEAVMLKYQDGDVSAMDELLIRYKRPVYQFAFRLSRNEAEAKDIAQEVFLRVHQYRAAYRPTGKFSTWIFGIAHNVFVDRFRKAKWLISWPKRHGLQEEDIEVESPDPSPLEVATQNDLQETIKKCIQSLPFLQKEAIILREYENLDYAEIAKILKKPEGTIKTLIYRARQRLKEKLLPYIEGGLQ
ncbi:MAG: RNA polymerase sigma factor [Candidatus Omnitrophica bacterium]|nr:RNA polymerase sigma factor [Candidatus Omnitrophota bacterium]